MKASRDEAQLSAVLDPIVDCYRFFRKRASQWLVDGEASGLAIEDCANALLTAICDKLQVVAIYLSHDENESAIFEALNARGEPLSEWEKVKNYILFKASEIPEVDQGELYERHLLEFDDRQWLVETGRGGCPTPDVGPVPRLLAGIEASTTNKRPACLQRVPHRIG
jgi:hypothetical protein